MNLDITNYFIYFIWNIIDIAIIIRYMNRLFGKIEKNKNIFYLMLMCIIIFTTISMKPYKNYLNPIAITSMSFFLLAFYSPNIQKKILFSAILLAIVGFWQMFLYFSISVFIPIKISMEFFSVCACHLGIGLLLELAPLMNKSTQNTIPYRLWFLLLFIPFASIITFFCIMFLISNSDFSKKVTLMELPVLLILLCINLMAFFIFDKFSTLITVTTEKALLEQQVIFQKQHFQQIEFVNNRIRSIGHDMKNNLQTISYLLENNKTSELKEYLDTLNNSIKSVDKIISTQNASLDAVLNIKIAEMKENHIESFSDITVPPNLKLTFEQSVILIGNIMDNAKEACILLPEENRWIRLKICYRIQSLYSFTRFSSVHLKPLFYWVLSTHFLVGCLLECYNIGCVRLNWSALRRQILL